MRRLVLALAALAASAVPVSAADDAPALDALVEQKAPAIVTLKFVSKVDTEEQSGETSAAGMDPTGLFVVGNGRLPGSPTSVKVLYGSDPTEHDAVLVARDTALGLAWVQVLDAGDKPVASVDWTKPATLRFGTPLYGITRSARAFDFAPTLQRCYAAAKIEKPRAMWAVAGEFSTTGLPVFDATGAPAGVLSRQGSEDSEELGSAERVCVLSPTDVARSLAAAKKRVPDAVAKAKEAREKEAEKEKEAAMDAPPPSGMGEAPKDAPPAPEKPR
jgi:hypothetical protein